MPAKDALAVIEALFNDAIHSLYFKNNFPQLGASQNEAIDDGSSSNLLGYWFIKCGLT